MQRWLSRGSLTVAVLATLLSLIMASGVLPRSEPDDAHPGSRCLFGRCGQLTNDPRSAAWIWISDNWPASRGTVVQLQPGLASTAFLRDTDAFAVPPGCSATDNHGKRFSAGWHKITDLYSGRLTVTCGPA